MKAKVLYLDTPLDPPGGGQISLSLVLRYLNKTRFEPSVFIQYKSKFFERVKEENIQCHIIPLRKLFSAIKRFNPSIVHCNSATTKYTFWSALISKFLGTPFIWHVRVVESAGWRDKIIAYLCTKIFVISDATKEKFAWVGNKNKIVKISNAVDTMVFRPGLEIEYLLNEFDIEKSKKIVGIFSRIDPWKGHIPYFNSARIIKDNIPDSIFLVVGEGEKEYKNQLINYVETLGLKSDVIFTGFRKDIPELMNLCDVMVSPSIEPESFGRTIIEAMACGKPVVSSNLGGPVEIISSDYDGIIVAPEPNLISAAVIKLLNDRGFSMSLGQHARQKVEDKFNVKKQISSIEEYYEELGA